jgi:endonuclease-3
MDPGTYTLLLELERETTVTFGSAGPRELATGYYVYTGSAFGPGGLSRVDRHRRVCNGENSTRHWHVDYLLGQPAISWVEAWLSPDRDAECEIAGALPGRSIEGIGATDCGCDSHLGTHPSREALLNALETVHDGRYSYVTHSEGD